MCMCVCVFPVTPTDSPPHIWIGIKAMIYPIEGIRVPCRAAGPVPTKPKDRAMLRTPRTGYIDHRKAGTVMNFAHNKKKKTKAKIRYPETHQPKFLTIFLVMAP